VLAAPRRSGFQKKTHEADHGRIGHGGRITRKTILRMAAGASHSPPWRRYKAARPKPLKETSACHKQGARDNPPVMLLFLTARRKNPWRFSVLSSIRLRTRPWSMSPRRPREVRTSASCPQYIACSRPFKSSGSQDVPQKDRV
jgi:hypothetical protein